MEDYSRILVTGGAGFIGSHLVDRLTEEGYEVVVLDNFFSGNLENIKQHLKSGMVHLVKGDVIVSDNVKEAIRNVDAVFHLAAIVSVPLSLENPLLVNDVNVKGTLTLLEASLKADVKWFTYASSCAVYGEVDRLPIDERCPPSPISTYAVSKLAAECYCKVFCENYGLDTLGLRYFNVYGPRQAGDSYSGVIKQFIDRLKHRRPPIIYGDGQQTRDFVHVKDVVEANVLALKCQRGAGEVINVGTAKSTTINQLANLLIGFSGQARLEPVFREPREGDIRNSYADIEKAEKMLGYKPKITLKKGLEMLLKTNVKCEND